MKPFKSRRNGEYWLIENGAQGDKVSSVMYDITEWEEGEKAFVKELSGRMLLRVPELNESWGESTVGGYLKALERKRKGNVIGSTSRGGTLPDVYGKEYWVLIY